jgi:6-phosphogluconolactonase
MHTSSRGFRWQNACTMLLALITGCGGGDGGPPSVTLPILPSQTNPPTPTISSPALNMVYTVGNLVNANTIIAFKRTAEGALEAVGEYPTEGKGLGRALGNQGALASNGEFIIAVNPGSDDISALKIEPMSLRFVDRIAAGGARPVSVAIHRDIVYVVNAGSDNIAGFRLGPSGTLAPLMGSEYGLTGSGTSPAQISFAADGTVLVVTERLSNKIASFPLTSAGLPRTRYAIDASTRSPYGFSIYGQYLVVSEEDGGRQPTSATSSYRVESTGEVSSVSPSVVSMQQAACWVAITPNRRFAYVANTGSSTISSYRLDTTGQITLLDSVAANIPRPLDIEVSPDGKFLHALNYGRGTIVTLSIAEDGSLSMLGTVGPIPSDATGLISF